MPAGWLAPQHLARLRQRLAQQLAEAPAGALLSISLDLGAGRDDWLRGDINSDLNPGLDAGHYAYWAQPDADDFRLGLGRAMVFASAGPARFSALQAAFAGTAQCWRHDDADGCGAHGHGPAAFLGFAFDEDQQGDLPNAQLIVPAVLLQSRHGRRTATFSCAARDGEAAMATWLAALRPGPAATAATGLTSCRPAPLAERAWQARVRAALADIAAGRLDKVVLGRSVHLSAPRPFAAARLLALLAARHPESTIYAIGHRHEALIGATPERLVALNAGLAEADALAGTAWPCPLSADARRATSPQLGDDKNHREQRLVVDAVRAALAPLCRRLAVPSTPEVLRLRHLQHLRTRIEGQLRPGVGLFDLIARLHPTPAVGGAPALAARHWLRRHHEQRGSWYSGGFGWIGSNGDGEVAVALRCASIKGKEAELFAGAGIVAGSDPEQELAETEAKLGVMLDALRDARAAATPDGVKTRTGTE